MRLAKLTGCFRSLPLPCANICLPLAPALTFLSASAGESSQELGPPPSVDEAANTLMTRLGFLLGDKVSEGPAGAQYSMEEPEARQVPAPSAAPDAALSPCVVSFYIRLSIHFNFKSYPNACGHFCVLVAASAANRPIFPHFEPVLTERRLAVVSLCHVCSCVYFSQSL